MILDKSLHLSEPQFLDLENGNIPQGDFEVNCHKAVSPVEM